MTNERGNPTHPPVVTQAAYFMWYDGPPTWTPVPEWPAGRPLSPWPRLSAGHSDDLTAAP